jgi:predicted SnoaL-like aldol condensation-catalyzing enzyme
MTRFSKLKLFGGALALLAMGSVPMAAQSKTPTKQEQANLKMVMDWWRIGLVSAHPEAADKYLAENMIQHNPNFPQGRAAVKAMLSRRPPVNPIPATLPPDRTPTKAFAKGDYVVLIWEREAADPTDPSKKYKYNDFDLFRVENGQLAEHWDGAMKNPPNGAGKE